MIGRKLSVRKSVSFKSNSSNRSREFRERAAGAGDIPLGVGAGAGSSSARNQNWIMQVRHFSKQLILRSQEKKTLQEFYADNNCLTC